MSGEIQQQLRQELKDAMRARDQARVDVVRQIETEISNAKTAPGFVGAVDDALYLKVIASYCKKMDKARKEYEQLGERGAEMATKLAYEVEYLSRWLPKRLDEQQTRQLLRDAIAELGIDDPKQLGRLIGHLMKQHKDDLDGALVNKLARDMLEPLRG